MLTVNHMKQSNFKRKAFSLLIVPFALGALPLSAEIPVANYYNGNSEIFEITDADNNRLFFYSPLYSNTARYIGAETENTHITLPESINKRVNEEWEDPVYEECVVNEFAINYDRWEVSPLGWSPNLNDITLTDNITSVSLRDVSDYRLINIHFTSENVPEYIDVVGMNLGDNLRARMPLSVPATALDVYKAAFDENNCMVIAEGTDPKDAYDQEIAALTGLHIVRDEDCVPYASWSATDGNGTLFAFEYPYENITLRGVITKEKSVTIPDYVYQAAPEWYALRKTPVSRCCLDYYNEDNTGFPGSSNLTDIYMPSGLYYAEFHGEGFDSRMNFHFSSPEAPEFRFYDGSSNYVNIYVPDDLFMTYADALDGNDYVLWSETPATPVNVNVATPGTLAEQIYDVIDDLNSVRWLVVTGTPDEVDLRMIRRLPRLEKLDLSATTGLAAVGGCNGLRYLREVLLPTGITSIDNSAFYECRRLQSIQLPESVTRIGDSAFEYTGVNSANLENIEYLGYNAFRCTKLTEISLDSAVEIGSNAFESCRIENVSFGPNVTSIGSYTFNDNRLVGTIQIPEKVTYVDDGIFQNNPNITKVIIHNKVTRIGYSAFRSYGSKLETVECNVLFPTDQNGFDGMDLSRVTLYVPSMTINQYLLHDNWLNFVNVEPLPYDLTDVDIDREFTITSDKGIADKATINLIESNYMADSRGHLTVNRKKDLNLSDFNMSGRYNGEYYDPNYGWRYGEYYNGSTIIPESTVTADNININLRLRTDNWTFLSFPFDINVKDIVVDEDALWVVRKYSGEARANLEENTWQNMADGTVLKAGEGYIFNCAAENRSEVNFTFTPASNGNAFFAKDAVEKSLVSYPAEFAHNASWNLVGNSYPAFLNLKGVDFEAPITVWQRGTYYAYSSLDDELVLQPFQAFFVQAQTFEGGDVLKLNPDARAHSREVAAEFNVNSVARAPRTNAVRSLFNIHINGENGSDRTRIVINEDASAAYESNRDASKFISSDELVPQIFVNNNGIRMAIDETPFGIGEFTLGARFGKKGEYTISLDTRDAEAFSALLIDNVTGEITDLNASEYVFDADASLNDSRFTLVISGTTTGIDAAVAEGLEVNVDGNELNIRSNAAVEITVASIDGKAVASALSDDFTTSLESGIYIVKAGQKTMKIKVGK